MILSTQSHCIEEEEEEEEEDTDRWYQLHSLFLDISFSMPAFSVNQFEDLQMKHFTLFAPFSSTVV